MTSPAMPPLSDIPQVTLFTKKDKKTGKSVKYTGAKYTYIDNIIGDKLEQAYTLRAVNKTTNELKKILEKGLLVVLNIKDGTPQSIHLPDSTLLRPGSEIGLSKIKKFVLVNVKGVWIDDKVAKLGLLPEKTPKKKLSDDRFAEIGLKLLNAQNSHVGLAPIKCVYKKT